MNHIKFKKLIAKFTLFFTFAVFIITVPSAWAGYSVIDLDILDSLEGFTHSRAMDINDYGHVVGYATGYSPIAGKYIDRAFLWADGKMYALPGLISSGESRAFAINNLGQVVGWAIGIIDDWEYERAVVWNEGVIQDLGTFNPDNSGSGGAFDINIFGDIVGVASKHKTDPPLPCNCFLWQGSMTNLAAACCGASGCGGTNSISINRHGQIVGQCGNSAYVLLGGVLRIDLGTLSGIGSSLAYAINKHGQVVGEGGGGAWLVTPDMGVWYRDNDNNGINDLMKELVGLGPPTYRTAAYDINDSGQAVGWSRTLVGDKATLWLPERAYDLDAGTHDLAYYVKYNSHWIELSSAYAINNAGQIAGFGSISSGGNYRAFLMTPEEYVQEPAPYSVKNFDFSGEDGEPVNTHTGELTLENIVDPDLGGPMPLRFSRYYASGLYESRIKGKLGDNWRHNFEWSLTVSDTTATVVTFKGRLITFEKNGTDWEIDSPAGRGLQLVKSGENYVFYYQETGLLYTFNSTGKLIIVEDGKGNSHTLTYGDKGLLSQVTDGLGRTLSFTYDLTDQLETVSDGSRTINFDHPGDYLKSFTDAMGNVTNYSYDTDYGSEPGLLTAMKLPEGNTPYTQTYWYSEVKVFSQTDAFANTTEFLLFMGEGIVEPGETRITDPLGNIRIHIHSNNGELTAVTDPNGQGVNMGYDSSGRRNTVTDKLGNTTSITYHAETGKRESVTCPDSSTISNVYSLRTTGGIDFYDLTATNFPDSTSYGFSFDESGNMTSFTDRAGNIATFTYNDKGQIKTATNQAGGKTTYTYNSDGTLASATDNAGNTTTYSYDSLLRRNLITHPDGATRSFTYDDNDRVISTTYEDGNTSSFAYDDNGNMTSITDQLGNVTLITYDAMDRFSSSTDPLGGVSSVTYDELGRISSQTNRNGNTSTFGYDTAGNLTTITDTGGKEWSMEYNSKGWLTSIKDPLDNTLNMEYDSMGHIIKITSPLGAQTQFSYDNMGRKTSELDPMGNTTTWSYDQRGLLAGITLPGSIACSYERDALGLVTTVIDPNGNKWRYAYNPQGELTTQTDPLGNVTSITYDSRNRPSGGTFPGGLGTVNVSYDEKGNVTRRQYSDGTEISMTYNAADRLTGTNNVTLTLDENGNIIGSNGLAIGRDTGGRIVSVTLATDKSITYSYDSRDNLKQVSDWIGGSTSFTYDVAGRLLTITRPNGVVTSYTYDADNNITGIDEEATSSISSISLTRNAIGNIISATRDVPLTPTLSPGTITLSYDAASQVAGFSYDSLGRLLNDGTRTYTWDLASRLTSYTEGAKSVTFTYDGLSSVLTRTEAGQTNEYVWNYAFSFASLSVIRQGDQDVMYYVYTPDGELLYSINALNNSKHFYHFDEMGSTLFLTNDTGTVTDRYAYTPYGVLTNSSGASQNPFTYIGKYGVMREGSSGLYRMRRRVYDAATKRFISRDPIADQSNPKAIVPYLYAAGNPLRYIDPTGEENADAAKAKGPVPEAVKTGVNANKKVLSVAGQVIDWKMEKSTDVADTAKRFNRLNKTFGNKNNYNWIDSATNHSEKLKRYKRYQEMGGDVVKGLELVVDMKERGPEAVAEFGAKEAAERVIGNKATGVFTEGIKTRKRVNNVQNDRRRNIRSGGNIFDKQTRAIRRAYFIEKTITYEEYEKRLKSTNAIYSGSLEAATESGIANIKIESLSGLQNMLMSFIGL